MCMQIKLEKLVHISTLTIDIPNRTQQICNNANVQIRFSFHNYKKVRYGTTDADTLLKPLTLYRTVKSFFGSFKSISSVLSILESSSCHFE